MYKEIIICLIIIVSIITLNIITSNYTKNTVEDIGNELDKFKYDIINEKIGEKEIKENNLSIMRKWKEKYKVLAYFIEHDELEKVETELTALEASIDVEEYEDGVENLERCIFILNHIKDKYSLNIQNIF